MARFSGGPWDGLDVDLPPGDFNEIVIRSTRYFPGVPHEYVYRRGEDGVYRLVPESAIVADNARLREAAKQQEAVADKLLGELQRAKSRRRV